uniref:Lysosomal trafficking regulator lyst n=1 Tax=Steinernema glaseri TaxID=37863 RepID=A0A1I8A3T5_9BILA
MDSVPYAFIDSVVELFDGRRTLNPLAQEVKHPLWKANEALNLFPKKKGVYTVGDLGPIRKNRRFARIIEITDDFFDSEDIDPQEDEEATKLLEAVVSQFESSSRLNSTIFSCLETQQFLLNSLAEKARLASIYLCYFGQASLDLLERQIRHSPFLKSVTLVYRNWPESVLPLITTFCLKGRPGHPVTMTLHACKLVSGSYIQNLFKLWQANGNLHFSLKSSIAIVDAHQLTDKGILNKQIQYRSEHYFKHETKKSVAYFKLHEHIGFTLKFYTCACGLSRPCTLKERYPNLHEF